MRTYIILILLIAIAIPMAIKFGIGHANVRTASSVGPGPCIINNFTDDSLQDRMLPKNLDNLKKPDAFQPGLDNHPKDGMVNMDSFDEKRNPDQIGEQCEFGLCTPGSQQPQNSQN